MNDNLTEFSISSLLFQRNPFAIQPLFIALLRDQSAFLPLGSVMDNLTVQMEVMRAIMYVVSTKLYYPFWYKRKIMLQIPTI